MIRHVLADLRPVRNGLPEFRPYVYHGCGYDVLETGEAS